VLLSLEPSTDDSEPAMADLPAILTSQ
jgi:hypothetical protein